MTSDPKPGPSHECESWQIRRHPSGGRYCAACGALQSREATPEGLQRLLGDVLAPYEEPEWAVEVPRGTVTGAFPEGRVSMESILSKRAAKCQAEGRHYVGGLNIGGACRACGTRNLTGVALPNDLL